MASDKNCTTYIGVTNNLLRRVIEHKRRIADSFSKKYYVNDLVYFEQTNDIRIVIQREKQIKKWNRKWKIALIKKTILNGMIFFMKLEE
ncbi:MAG: GIY-YIG nuclease family protein [Ignavibacteria bacterium]